jgi:hypothetical protein
MTMRKSLCALLLLLTFHTAGAQEWDRLELDHGGVVEDLQLITRNDSNARNTVWAACMSGGLYRSTWSGSAWNAWQEYKPGKHPYGVDAIELITASPASDKEYVLMATTENGVYYNESDAGSSWNPGDWVRPGLIPQCFPLSWTHATMNDAAFYWPPPVGSLQPDPMIPKAQFYVVLSGDCTDPMAPHAIFHGGIYRWSQTASPTFTRVDPGNTEKKYSHFYRDLRQPNALYVTSDHGLYKLSGPYGKETFEKLPPGTKLEDLPISKPPKNLPVIK